MQPLIRAAILVASDKGAAGEREDKSGELIQQRLREAGVEVAEKRIVPDDEDALAQALIRMCDTLAVDVVITSGGTGFTERDVTPEATARIVRRMVPGIPEAIRAEGLKKTPHAMLSRGIAGIRGHTLVVNLPGSTGGVKDGLAVLERILEHAVETLRSASGVECGESPAP